MTEHSRPEDAAPAPHPLFDLTPMPVFVIDLRGRVLRANAAARVEFGDTVPSTLRELWEQRAATSIDGDAPLPFLESAGMRALAGHTIRGARTRARSRDGDARILATYAAPIRDAAQRVTGAVVQECDVTATHERHAYVDAPLGRVPMDTADATSADPSAARVLAAVANVTSVVVHDVNNALNPILSAAYLLEHHAESPDMVRHYAQRIRQATEAGAMLANRLGRVVRQAPLRDDEGELIQVSTLVDQAVSGIHVLLSSSERVNKPQLTITHGEPNSVRALSTDLVHALGALLQNAVDASPPGGTITITTSSTDAHARITIRDTGCGMSAAVMARAFEPFYSTKRVPGAGLGLAEAYSIARRHGGDVLLESAEGVGTAVALRLPRAEPTSDVTTTESTRQTILVVEDHDDGREFLKRVLESAGHTVDAVATCADARTRLAGDGVSVYNLLLTDVSLPDGSGWELLAFVRAQRSVLRVGIITGWEPLADGEVALGAAFILQKPLRATELLQRVEGRRTSYPLE